MSATPERNHNSAHQASEQVFDADANNAEFKNNSRLENLNPIEQRGQNIANEVLGIPEDYELTSSQRCLFGLLENKDTTGFPAVDGAPTITALGLEFSGKRLDFNDDVRQILLDQFIDQKISEVGEDGLFSNDNPEWLGALGRASDKVIRKIRHDKREEMINEKRSEIHELEERGLSMRRPVFKHRYEGSVLSGPDNSVDPVRYELRRMKDARAVAKYEELISKHKQQEKDAQRLHNQADLKTEEIGIKEYKSKLKGAQESLVNNSRMAKEVFDFSDDFKESIELDCPGFLEDYIKTVSEIVEIREKFSEEADGNNKITTITNPLDKLISIEKREYRKKLSSGSDDVYVLQHQKSSTLYPGAIEQHGHDYDSERKTIKKQVLSNSNLENKEELLDRYTELINKYYQNLFPRVYDKKAEFEFPLVAEVGEKKSELSRFRKDSRGMEIDRDEVDAKICADFVKEIFPEAKSAGDVQFFPIGAAIRTEDGSIIRKTISPLSKEVLEKVPSESIKTWTAYWTSIRSETDQFAVKNIHEAITSQADMSEREEAIKQLGTTYNVLVPEFMNPKTGRFNEVLTKEQIAIAERILESIGGYIHNIKNSRRDEPPTLKELRLGTLAFLTGESSRPLPIFKGDHTLDVGELRDFLSNINKDKVDVAERRLAASFSISMYCSLSDEKRVEFERLLGSRSNVSAMDFYATYRKRIENDELRQKIAARSFFVSEFAKHVRGESAGPMKEFFDSLKKATVIA